MKLLDLFEQNVPQSTTITPQMRTQWNQFIDWVSQNYPNGIRNNGADPTAKLVTLYKTANPSSVITPTNVIDFQKDIISYNEKWKSLQDAYKPQGNTLSVTSPTDNRIGLITSQMRYPEVSINVNGKMTNFGTDIDAAINANKQNKSQETYIDPNLTPQQRFEKNQQLRIQGKPLPTNNDMQVGLQEARDRFLLLI